MNWDAISSIAEMIAAIGVILSLLYVGRELKQSNLMARSSTRQEINAAINSWSMNIATSPTLSGDFAEVQLKDLVRYALFAFINQHRYAYEQWTEGIISEKELNEIFGPGSANILNTPYLRSAWPIIRVSLPSEFADWYTKRYQLHDEASD
jgi:hypothetical protein